MIILDSDVFSALMSDPPVEPVVAWLERQDRSAVATTTITIFEVQFGIRRRPPGKRRTELELGFESVMRHLIAGSIVQLAARSATIAAELASTREKNGLNIGVGDTLIAGIVLSHGATLATRNIRHFADLAIDVVNPWGEDDPGPDD